MLSQEMKLTIAYLLVATATAASYTPGFLVPPVPASQCPATRRGPMMAVRESGEGTRRSFTASAMGRGLAVLLTVITPPLLGGSPAFAAKNVRSCLGL